MFGNASKPLFGVQQTSSFAPTTQSGFTFGSTSTSGSSAFSFNVKPTLSSAFNLAPIPAKTTSNIFGGLGTTASTTSPFSFTAVSKPGPLLNSAVGTTAVSTKSASLFSLQPNQAYSGLQLGGGFLAQNAPSQQQQQQMQQSVDVFYASLSQPMPFGDERDSIIARLNQLQAMVGKGTGYSALGTVTYSPDNPFSRFRGIAYNVMPTSSEADGLVCMELTRPFAEVLPQKQNIQDHLLRLLGGRANYQVVIEEIRPAVRSESYTEVVFKVVERQVSGNTHVVPATNLATFLCGTTIKPQLESQLCVCRLMPELAPTASQVNAYLELPPAGFDKRVWQQAREDNPAPDRLIPVPVIGFGELKRRRDEQLLFGEQQRKSVKHLLSVTSGLHTQQLSISQKITQIKHKQIELNHRILKLLAKQAVARRAGFAISAEEEALRCALEHIWSEITAPRGLRARIQQLLPSVRTKATTSETKKLTPTGSNGSDEADTSTTASVCWWHHPEIVDDLREYLSQRTTGIKEMRRLLNELNTIVLVLAEKKSKASAAITAPIGLPTYSALGIKLKPAL